MSRSLSLLAAAVAFSAPFVTAAHTYVGCIGAGSDAVPNPFPDDTLAVVNSITRAECDVSVPSVVPHSPSHSSSSPSSTLTLPTIACCNLPQPVCNQGDYKDITGSWEIFFYFPDQPIETLVGDCLCSWSGPTQYLIVPAFSPYGDCEYGDFRLINNPWDFRKCLSGYSVVGSSSVVNAAGPEACFAACAGWDYALGKYTSGGMECTCANSIAGGVETTCTADSVYAWTREGIPSVSGLRRRAVQAQKALGGRRAGNFCPRGFSACTVRGTAEYECLDTRSELGESSSSRLRLTAESCGGCVHGNFSPVRNHTLGVKTLQEASAQGVDCTALPGVHPSGIQCSRGQCVVTACRRGFALVDGGCVSA